MFLDLAREAPVERAAWGGTSAVGSLEGASRVTRSLPAGLGRALHEGRVLLRVGRVHSR